jgi:uncharacterized protein (TIGR03382 family)
MKTSCYLCMAGCCAPLILATSANATFTGLSTEARANPFGIDVISVYANFDQLGDQLTAIAGTPSSPLNLSVMGGTFYQHAMGSDRAPLDPVAAIFPSVAFDTFVTVGVNLLDMSGGGTGQSQDLTFMTPFWPGFGPSSLTTMSEGWFVPPFSPQADPFNPAFVAGDGRTLIAQLATTDGVGFEGTMLVQFMSGGLPGAIQSHFTHAIPAPGTLALLGVAGLWSRRRRRPTDG